MPKKRKTLPKDFEELLKKGNLEELKSVFNTCELNATGGYAKATALSFDDCSHELAKWLVEQGADLQAKDTWKNTALHKRSRSMFGNIKSLLELGADVNDNSSSVGTPLHAAADSHNVENTRLLLAHGAKVDTVNSYDCMPLEQALRTCSNIDIVKTVKIAAMYFEAGVQINPKMKAFVKEIGERFEFSRAGFNKDSVDEFSEALHTLYRMFDVEPVAKRVMHDGKSVINSSTTRWQDQHQELWELLVPSSGPAQTMQGEVIRITGRISNELEGNGGINWDADYKKMADTFLEFIKQGEPLATADMLAAEETIKQVKQRAGSTALICELAVKWVTANPKPLNCPALDYRR